MTISGKPGSLCYTNSCRYIDIDHKTDYCQPELALSRGPLTKPTGAVWQLTRLNRSDLRPPHLNCGVIWTPLLLYKGVNLYENRNQKLAGYGSSSLKINLFHREKSQHSWQYLLLWFTSHHQIFIFYNVNFPMPFDQTILFFMNATAII